MSLEATFRVRWQARALGLGVLALAGGAAGLIAGEDASPWSWVVVGITGAAALTATIANFGEVVRTSAEGITQVNELLARFGLGRRRSATWADVLRAVDQDGLTYFLEVRDQGRWVLDQLDQHEHLRLILEDRGITVERRKRPSLVPWRRDPLDGR